MIRPTMKTTKRKKATMRSLMPYCETIWDKRGIRTREWKKGEWGKWEWITKFVRT